MKILGGWGGCGVVLVALGACAGKSDEPEKAATPAGITYLEFCKGVCALETSCAIAGAETCQLECENNLASVGPKARNDYWLGYLECVEEHGCNGLLKATRGEDECDLIAGVILEPRPAAIDSCALIDKKAAECSFASNPGFCLVNSATFNDAVNHEVATCVDKPCADLNVCLTSTWGFR